MAMTKGTVSIDPGTGEASGSGAALVLYDALDATMDYPELEGMPADTIIAAKQQLADMCNAFSEIIDYIKDNAELNAEAADVQSGTSTAEVTGTIT